LGGIPLTGQAGHCRGCVYYLRCVSGGLSLHGSILKRPVTSFDTPARESGVEWVPIRTPARLLASGASSWTSEFVIHLHSSPPRDHVPLEFGTAHSRTDPSGSSLFSPPRRSPRLHRAHRPRHTSEYVQSARPSELMRAAGVVARAVSGFSLVFRTRLPGTTIPYPLTKRLHCLEVGLPPQPVGDGD